MLTFGRRIQYLYEIIYFEVLSKMNINWFNTKGNERWKRGEEGANSAQWNKLKVDMVHSYLKLKLCIT